MSTSAGQIAHDLRVELKAIADRESAITATHKALALRVVRGDATAQGEIDALTAEQAALRQRRELLQAAQAPAEQAAAEESAAARERRLREKAREWIETRDRLLVSSSKVDATMAALADALRERHDLAADLERLNFREEAMRRETHVSCAHAFVMAFAAAGLDQQVPALRGAVSGVALAEQDRTVFQAPNEVQKLLD